MFYRNYKKEILATVVAALFVAAFSFSAFSAENMPSLSYEAGNYLGKVIAIDNFKKSVTVRSAMGNEKMFMLTDNGQVLKCGKAAMWDDIKVGDDVIISYFEKTPGNYVADSLTLSIDMGKCS